MTESNQNKKNEGNSNVNPVIAGVTGAIIGASVAVAGSVVLSDKKNRNKVVKVLQNVKEQAVGYVGDLKQRSRDEKGELDKKITEGKEKAKKMAASVNDSIHQGVKNVKKAV